MNRLIIILFSLSITGCGISGLYYNKRFNKRTPDALLIELCKDGSFTFYSWSDIMGEGIESGTWTRTGNVVQFDPIPKYETPETKVYSTLLDQDYTKITFHTVHAFGDTITLSFIDTVIVGGERFALDTLGTIHLDSTPRDPIKLDILLKDIVSIQDSIFYLDADKNDFDIYISEGFAQPFSYYMAQGKKVKSWNGLFSLDSLGKVDKDFKWKKHKCGCGHINNESGT